VLVSTKLLRRSQHDFVEAVPPSHASRRCVRMRFTKSHDTPDNATQLETLAEAR
jgi:hypothetical protein